MSVSAYQVINDKKLGRELSGDAISWLVGSYMSGDVSDAQMAAFLMATCINGMTDAEAFALAGAMAASGQRWSTGFLDKHSTGGVGDKTTFLVASMLAACGMDAGMMSGRGLGHTGGTLDKLESVRGLSVSLSREQYIATVRDCGMSIISQTEEIAPADKRLYELRNITATIDSIPLIAASIMSKKIASGPGFLVLDVKYGPAAFMRTKEQAEELAALMEKLGEANGIATRTLLTPSDDVLGDYVGNAVEIAECLDVMCGAPASGLSELSVKLAGELASMAGRPARRELEASLHDGSAIDAFHKFLACQGGQVVYEPNLDADERKRRIISAMPMPTLSMDVLAKESGTVTGVNAERIGLVAAEMGANRLADGDSISHDVGIRVNVHLGDKVEAGDVLASVLYGEESARRVGYVLRDENVLRECWEIGQVL